MSNRSVTFETKVGENDWELILKTSRIANAIERCDFPFSDKKVFINNVKNRKLVETAAQKLVNNGTIDSFVFVDDFAKQALSHGRLKFEVHHLTDYQEGYGTDLQSPQH